MRDELEKQVGRAKGINGHCTQVDCMLKVSFDAAISEYAVG
jgi:hypothetical protein